MKYETKSKKYKKKIHSFAGQRTAVRGSPRGVDNYAGFDNKFYISIIATRNYLQKSCNITQVPSAVACLYLDRTTPTM